MERDDLYPGWLCASCKHLTTPIETRPPVCDAYPEGIPFEIVTGTVRHRKEHPGDNGIQYEKLTKGDKE